MYLPQAVVMIAAGIIFQRFSHRIRIERLISEGLLQAYLLLQVYSSLVPLLYPRFERDFPAPPFWDHLVKVFEIPLQTTCQYI